MSYFIDRTFFFAPVILGAARPEEVSRIYTVMVVITIIELAVIYAVLFYGIKIGLWYKANRAGARIAFGDYIKMRMRCREPEKVVLPYVFASRGGLGVDLAAIEAHYLCGGDAAAVIKAMLAAKNEGIETDFRKVCAYDLAGEDLVERIKSDHSTNKI